MPQIEGSDQQYGLQRAEERPGEVTKADSFARITTADFMPPKTGVLSTAKNPNTGAPPATVNDDSIVEVQGMTMRAVQAAQAGYLKRSADGSYADVSSSEQPPKEPQQRQPQDHPEDEDAPQPFNSTAEAALTYFAGRVPGQVQDAIISQVISGGMDSLDMKTAGTVGMTASEFHGGVSGIVENFQRQADAAITGMGVNPEAFYEWAKENAPGELQDAMRRLVYDRNAKAFRPLVQRALRFTPPTAEDLTKAGYSVTTRSGVDLVTINGFTMTVRDATRQGLFDKKGKQK